jgi:hypothetical protein
MQLDDHAIGRRESLDSGKYLPGKHGLFRIHLAIHMGFAHISLAISSILEVAMRNRFVLVQPAGCGDQNFFHLTADAWVREGGELGLVVWDVAETGAHQPEMARADQIVHANRWMYRQEGAKRGLDAAKVFNNKAVTFEG